MPLTLTLTLTTPAQVEGAVPFVNEIYIDLCHQVGTPPHNVPPGGHPPTMCHQVGTPPR